MKGTLTDEQVSLLAPYEARFAQVLVSGNCPFPGQSAIERMKAVWETQTGSTLPMRPGCSVCLFNLLKDLGTLYFAAVGKRPEDCIHRVVRYYDINGVRIEHLPAKEAEKTPVKAASTKKAATPRKSSKTPGKRAQTGKKTK